MVQYQFEGKSLLFACLYILYLTYVAAKSIDNFKRDSEGNLLKIGRNGFYILEPNQKTAGSYKKAAVASSSKRCAEAGAKLLKQGGSAVDAAIGTLLCDGVVSLQGLGIGGGFLMTIWDAKNKTATFLNAREYAPKAASETVFTVRNENEAKFGAKAIAVPGEIAGYWAAHQRYGRLNWSLLFDDAIALCRGVPVSRYIANDIKKVSRELDHPKFSPLQRIVCINSVNCADYGSTIQRLALRETLIKIRDHGPDVLYKGELAEKLINDIREAGGIMTLEDLRNYTVEWKDPVKTTIRNKTLYSSPTPGSGAVLGFMLNILDDLIHENMDRKLMWQYIAETFKWGYARRNEIGDFIERPEYDDKYSKNDCRIKESDVALKAAEGYTLIERGRHKWDKDCLMNVAFKKLLSKEYAAEVRNIIKRENTTHDDYEHYNITQEGRIDLGTAHTSVYAEDGSAVSVTSTINHLLGSLFWSKSTGIILNNEMDDYSYPGIVSGFGVEPSEFNFVRNRTRGCETDSCRRNSKLRPMSSMTPTIILNDDESVRLIIGSAGGTKITTGVAQGIILNLFLNYGIKEAIDHPRIHHNLWPMALQREELFDKDIIEYLNKTVGHDLDGWLIMQNTMAGIAVNGLNNITASGDYRREGGTAGY